MTVDEEAAEIVRRTQTEHAAHLVAAFFKTLVADGVGRMIARDLTEKWIDTELSKTEDE